MRLARVLLAIFIGIFVGTLVGVCVGVPLSRVLDTRDRFVADFDQNIQQVPIAASVIARDPEFRARVVRATAEAYARGGWPAADDALDTMMLEKQPEVTWTILHADDAHVVALWSAFLAVMKRLPDKPAACRYYVSGRRARGVSFPSAQAEYRAAVAAANAAYASGARNLANRTAPHFPSLDAAAVLLERSTELGQPYSEAERRALLSRGANDGGGLSDSLVCAASIKLFQDVLALPQADAAALIRYQWGQAIPSSVRDGRG
jgi:hypothetical protein